MRAINVREQRISSFYSSSSSCCCPTLLTNSIHSCHLPIPSPTRTPATSSGCLWLCIFDLLSSFSYFLLFWHSQRLHWTHKGGQKQERVRQVVWAGMQAQRGEGRGGVIWSAALTNFVRLHFAHGPETTSARRSLHGVFFCFDFTFLCNIYTQYFQQLQWGSLNIVVHNYLEQKSQNRSHEMKVFVGSPAMILILNVHNTV